MTGADHLPTHRVGPAALQPPTHQGAHIYALSDGFIYAAPRAFAGNTVRLPIVLLLSLSDRPVRLWAAGETLSAMAVLVAPKALRSFTLEREGVASINIEPSHVCYPALRRALRAPAIALEMACLDALHPVLVAAARGTASWADVNAAFAAAVSLTFASLNCQPRSLDRRISHLLVQSRTMACVDFDYGRVRRSVGLSASRLSHLFAEEVGLPMRSFMSWRKTREALCRLPVMQNVTMVAHEAGFADSAHLSRTMKSSLGIRPSSLSASSQIQFHDMPRC